MYVPPDNTRNRARSGKAGLRIPLLSPLLNGFMMLGGALVLLWACTLPAPVDEYSLDKTLDPPAERELILQTADGEPFARRGGCIDAPVRLGEVPQHFIDALLAMEDRRFYSHPGIDPRGALRAAIANYSAGRIVQGGSTITQQLAKVSYLSDARTYDRKMEEALIALWLELNLSKQEILERYLNQVYFGQGCYGLRAAAKHHFDRPVSELTRGQSALLVALLKSPTRLLRDREALEQRAELVLQAMVEDDRLDPEAAEDIDPVLPRSLPEDPLGAYYADWIADTFDVPQDGETAPLPVRTAYEPELQKLAREAMRDVLDEAGERRRAGQAALVAMRPSGKVVAIVGGRDYESSQFNRATQALRQPGSSFKTFVYLAALRAGARLDMSVSDAPLSIGGWSPENYDHSYRGVISLHRAFISSINTAAVRVSEAVGREKVAAAARDMGITSPLLAMPSLALGASEVTLLELTSAYAAIAADAYPVRPWGVLSAGEDASGAGEPPDGAGRWQLANGASMRDLLESVVQSGTGRGARLPIRAYGKTGTSQNYRDAWFIGFAGNLVVGVWVGNDDNTPMKRVTGGSLPAQIWRAFMTQARDKDPEFKRRLPRIAAFRARPRARFETASAADLQAALVPQRRMYSDRWYGPGNRRRFRRPPRFRDALPLFRDRGRRRQERSRSRGWRSRGGGGDEVRDFMFGGAGG